MNQECQDVTDQQTFTEGDPQHLVLAQTKALSDPLDVCLMPQQDRAGLPRLLRLLGFLCHKSIMAPGYPTFVASDATGHRASELRLHCSQLICTSESGEDTSE